MPAGCGPDVNDWCCSGCREPSEAERQRYIDLAISLISQIVGDRSDDYIWFGCESRIWRPCPDPCGCGCPDDICCTRCEPSTIWTVPGFRTTGDILAIWVDGVRYVQPVRVNYTGTVTQVSPIDIGSGIPSILTGKHPQDLNKFHTLPGTWGIEVRTKRIPVIMDGAILGIACELSNMCNGSACDLPAGAVSLNSDGVSISFNSGTWFAASTNRWVAELDRLLSLYGSALSLPASSEYRVGGVWERIDP